MRISLAYAALSAFLILSACDSSSKSSEVAAPATPATPPPPEYVNLAGCALVVETVARERLIGEKRVPKDGGGIYLAKLKGETSGGDYDLECVDGEGGAKFRIAHASSIGSVSISDLEGHKSAALNPALIGVGEEGSIPEKFAFAGEVDADGFLDLFFSATQVEIPEEGQYCLGVVAKFTGKSGTGSTYLAIDGGEWVNWGHPVEDGVNFTTSGPQALKAGWHTIYLQKREDKLSRFRITKC